MGDRGSESLQGPRCANPMPNKLHWSNRFSSTLVGYCLYHTHDRDSLFMRSNAPSCSALPSVRLDRYRWFVKRIRLGDQIQELGNLSG